MTSTQEASSSQSKDETCSSGTATKVDFDNLFFESELFKITLTDPNPNESLPIATTQGPAKYNPEAPTTISIAHDSGTVFYVHKGLLASLSPELAKHTENRMKEGLSGEMSLGGVDTSTMQWFLQWAYHGECKFTEFPDTATTMHCYAKLYILGDRFNITALQNFSFKNICQVIPQLVQEIKTTSHLQQKTASVLLLKTMHYIADNVAPRTPPDRLVEYLSKTIAFTIAAVRVLPEFSDLVHAQPEAVIAVFMSVREAAQPPYPSDVLPSGAYQPIKATILKSHNPRLAKCSKETRRLVGNSIRER